MKSGQPLNESELEIVDNLKNGATITQVCRKTGLTTSVISRIRDKYGRADCVHPAIQAYRTNGFGVKRLAKQTSMERVDFVHGLKFGFCNIGKNKPSSISPGPSPNPAHKCADKIEELHKLGFTARRIAMVLILKKVSVSTYVRQHENEWNRPAKVKLWMKTKMGMK